MGYFTSILTVAKWEVLRNFRSMSRNVLPPAVLLFSILVLATAFAAQSGIHLQDGMYRIGVNDPTYSTLFSGDGRFSIYEDTGPSLYAARGSYDALILDGKVIARNTERGRAALHAIQQDYSRYVIGIYSSQEDLFAAYPLWIDPIYVQSELSFEATQSGQYLGARYQYQGTPVPDGPITDVQVPSGTLITQREVLRREVVKGADQNDQVARYTGMLSADDIQSRWRIPSQLSPPLPFDSIILVFVFIFPLYFISQFCMMSVMNERLERRGEPLLSTPLAPSAIIAGKILPYFAGMGLIATALTLWLGAPLVIVLPLLPVMLFFLANALLIGMVARSFKELSFISIFFSTLATSYLFFPTIFANVHVVSLISPLTLIVLALQGAGFSAADYFYSTALFYLTSAVLFYVAVANFREERLFTQSPFFTRIREFIEEGLSRKRPLTSLFVMNMLLIPFVFMVQMMFLVLFFNIPMPLSLILLIGLAALAEEVVKSLGIYTLFSASRSFASWRFLIPASAVTALGFLAGEKLFLFAMLSQITDSVFGSILFLSLQVLWMPFLIHFTGVLIVGISLRYLGKQGYVPALLLATVVHALYNIILLF